MNHHFHHNISIMSLLNTCVLFHFVANFSSISAGHAAAPAAKRLLQLTNPKQQRLVGQIFRRKLHLQIVLTWHVLMGQGTFKNDQPMI